MLNGRPVIIGRNLDGALRQLRRSMSGHLLWIDALCINQEDVSERSQQVQLMGDIFSSAEQVIIWLGHERKNDQYAIDMITRDQIPDEANEFMYLMRVLKRVCLRPWFGRFWIVQELALAKRSPLLQFVPQTVLWDRFRNYLEAVYEESELREADENWPFLSVYAYRQAFRRVKNLDDLRTGKFHNITFQLDTAARLQASDPWDQVYGLLGICAVSPHQRPIVVDYSKNARQVFLETTCTMLLGNIWPYQWFPLYPPPDSSQESSLAPMRLPSWAFDLRIRPHTHPATRQRNLPVNYLITRYDHFDLAATISHLPPHSRFSTDLQRLHTLGIHIGTVSVSSADLLYASHPTNVLHRALTATNIRTF